MKYLREFKCALTGEEVLIFKNQIGEEIALPKVEYSDLVLSTDLV